MSVFRAFTKKKKILHNLLKNVKKKNAKEYFVVTLQLHYV